MKNITLGFLIAVVCMFTIATTVPNSIMTVKPSRPISTVHYVARGYNSLDDMNDWIKQKIREGFIVKSVAYGDGFKSSGGIVVMEKY